MLAKMGWSKGKGLGAKENGAHDFIRVKYKNDIGGLGYEARDDHWTQNESDFNALLENLSQNHDTSGVEPGKASLEEKSKKSRARVHYQKFTRGKDISRYSEKDLANIFGKKSLEESYKVEIKDQEASKSNDSNKNGDIREDYGTKIINTGVSIQDYFKQKRSKLNGEVKEIQTEELIESSEKDKVSSEEVDQIDHNISKTKKRKRKENISSEKSIDGTPDVKSIEEDENSLNRHKKKKKADKDSKSFCNEDIAIEEAPLKKSKKIKSKNTNLNEEKTENNIPSLQECTTQQSKSSLESKKKKKNKCVTDNSEQEQVASTDSSKKKNKNENSSTEEDTTSRKISDHKKKEKNTITPTDDLSKFFLDSLAVEKLKHLKLEKFKQSNIADIVGYGLSKDVKLEIRDSSIIKGISHVNKYSIYANVDKMHSKKYYKSLLLRYHKKRNTFKV